MVRKASSVASNWCGSLLGAASSVLTFLVVFHAIQGPTALINLTVGEMIEAAVVPVEQVLGAELSSRGKSVAAHLRQLLAAPVRC